MLDISSRQQQQPQQQKQPPPPGFFPSLKLLTVGNHTNNSNNNSKDQSHPSSAAVDNVVVVDSPTPTNDGTARGFPNMFFRPQSSSVPKEACEQLGRKLRRAGLIRDHQIWTLSQGIKVFKEAFKGQDFVAWLMREQQSLTREDALDKGQWLIEHRVAEPVQNSGGGGARSACGGGGGNLFSKSPTTPVAAETPGSMFPPGMGRSFSTERYYKLVDDQHDQRLPLNALDECLLIEECAGGTITMRQRLVNVREFNARLCAVVDRIYGTILSEDRRVVHLDLLDDCEPFTNDYLALTREAAHLDIGAATAAERLAVFINLHNMMLVHITYRFGLPGTIWQRRKYLYSTYYTIGGHLYSLQSIFNGLLRGNRKGLGMLWAPFGGQDLRREFMIKGGEPLVHFGLNNYTRSSPPLRTYSTEHVYDELWANARQCLGTREFLQIDWKQGKVLLAKLFKQYAEDFGPGSEDPLKWLVRVLEPGEERTQLAKLLYTRSYSLAYLSMDMDLNMTYGLPAAAADGTQFCGGAAAGQNGGGNGRRGASDWSTGGGVPNTVVELAEDDFCYDSHY